MRLQVGKSYYTRQSSRVIGPMEEDSRTGLFYAPSLGEFNSNIGTNFMNYKPNRWFPTGAILLSAANPFDLVDVVPDPLYIWANMLEVRWLRYYNEGWVTASLKKPLWHGTAIFAGEAQDAFVKGFQAYEARKQNPGVGARLVGDYAEMPAAHRADAFE